ncbi:MAG: OsmC family protein [Bacteroidetes bacterium]|nr:OsmC family protein [Bacteroidota bacterium]
MNFSVQTNAHIGRDAYRTEIQVRHHQLIADEPEANGGKDLGPTAHELLAAALCACTNATVRMYADRKQWPLEAIDTSVTVEHGASFDDTRITRTVHFTGDLSDEQRARLMQIADRCPIHRTLGGTIQITTSEMR